MSLSNETAYYVRPVNGSDANDGQSFGSAWKTWRHAFNTLTEGAGVSANNAILFMVNETGDAGYTGPYHGPTGADTTIQYGFQDGTYNRFQICGLSADGNYYQDVNFIFDLSGFTYSNWIYSFSSNTSSYGIMWRNITWRNATTSIGRILYSSYDDDGAYSDFWNCIWEDNEVTNGLVGYGNYSGSQYYYNCIVRRNNSYDSNRSLFSASNYGVGSRRNPGANFYRCIFHDNQTDPSASPYINNANSRGGIGVRHHDCLFYNNGYDTNSVCLKQQAEIESNNHRVENCVFFNNAGTAVLLEDTYATDASYVNSVYGQKIFNNVFAYNNKGLDIEAEPGVRDSMFVANVFWNNTVDDIPSILDGVPGTTGANYVFDPEFTNGYSGDFSVSSDSDLYTYSMTPGTPIGGSFVRKRPFTTSDEGSLSLGTGGVGDTVTVSGRSFQKVDDDPIVWRRV